MTKVVAGALTELRPPRHNSEVEWSKFNSEKYWESNYKYLRDDDRQIIRVVAEFFGGHFDGEPPRERRALDIGTGPNLYPALSMLPWSTAITLVDFAQPNREWLKSHLQAGSEQNGSVWSWQPFWDELILGDRNYRTIDQPRFVLAEAVGDQILPMSLMELPELEWDLGTMFFLAESMTSYEQEFEDAVEKFVGALKPGAPFAAAFMDGSNGYKVDGTEFPSVAAVNSSVVKSVLEHRTRRLQVVEIGIPELDPLRDGYDGMIIAVGVTEDSGQLPVHGLIPEDR